MSMVFDDLYSEFYDLIYKDKNYLKESEYIKSLIKKHSSIKVDSILELGCGTGKHASYFLDDLTHYCGVDLSSFMLNRFRQNLGSLKDKVQLVEQNVTKLKLNCKFDCVLSLFHVASYQTTIESLDNYFQAASTHLKDNGLFIFDFWYGPAVLLDQPFNKHIEVENDKVKVTRFATPMMHFNENIVDVNFKVWIEDKLKSKVHQINEIHHMRYIFLTEIAMLAAKYDLKVKAKLKWLTEENISEKSWYGVVVLEK